MPAKVKIVWNNMGGEMDSVTVEDNESDSVTNALIAMVKDEIVSPGDSFTIEEVG